MMSGCNGNMSNKITKIMLTYTKCGKGIKYACKPSTLVSNPQGRKALLFGEYHG